MSVTEGGISMLLVDLQEENASLPIFLSSFLSIYSLQLHASIKASTLITVTVGGTAMHTREVPLANAHSLITTTPLLRIKVVNFEQYANAQSWIDLMALGHINSVERPVSTKRTSTNHLKQIAKICHQ